MGIVSTIEDALTEGTEESTDESTPGSKGAYWCDDCGVRIRDVDLDAEDVAYDETDTPQCPDCGSAMRFERSHADGCAC